VLPHDKDADKTCVDDLTIHLVTSNTTSAPNALTNGYQALFGWGQSIADNLPTFGEPTLDYSALGSNFIMQMYLQFPNFNPLVCWNVFWSTSKDEIGLKKESQVTIGHELDHCFGDTSYTSIMTDEKDFFCLYVKKLNFGLYNDVDLKHNPCNTWDTAYPYIGIPTDYWPNVQSQFEYLGFDCSSIPCQRPKSCSYIATFVPEYF